MDTKLLYYYQPAILLKSILKKLQTTYLLHHALLERT